MRSCIIIVSAILLPLAGLPKQIIVTLYSAKNIDKIVYNDGRIESYTGYKDSVHYYYEGSKLKKILLFKKNGMHFSIHPADSSLYTYGLSLKVQNVEYSNKSLETYESCTTALPFINTLNIMNIDFCYYDIILRTGVGSNYAPLFKKNGVLRELVGFKIDVNLVMLKGERQTPFSEGTYIKKVTFHQRLGLLTEVDAFLIDHLNQEKKFFYKKYYRYDKFSRLIETRTILGSSVQENTTNYKYNI